MQRDDVGMIQGRSGPGFLKEAALTFRSGDSVVRQCLKRDGTIQPGIRCAKDLAHSTRAQERFDFVRAELSQAWCGQPAIVYRRSIHLPHYFLEAVAPAQFSA